MSEPRRYDGEADGDLSRDDPRVYRKFAELFQNREMKQDFFGASPPTIFVGRYSYPKVNVGVLSPVDETDSSGLDAPNDWFGQRQGIEEIIGRRSALVNSRTKSTVTDTSAFVDVAKEIAMARKPVDVEVHLKRMPKLELNTDSRFAPYGPAENLERVEIAENPSVARAVEKAVGDDDWQASGAMSYLYRKDLDTHQIQRVLSAGLLGEKDKRRMVPTRWSITAADDTVGQSLRDDIATNQELGELRYFTSSYLGNTFHILLIPGRWEYELVEIKGAGSVWAPGDRSFVKSDYEPFEGRTGYVDETAGGYYAARLGPLEYLQEINRQAKVLIIRDISDAYWAPLGVWVVRETVRGAFQDKAYDVLPTVNDALSQIRPQLSVPWDRIRQKSELIRGRQQSLGAFL